MRESYSLANYAMKLAVPLLPRSCTERCTDVVGRIVRFTPTRSWQL
jgi:hypothetical protein